MQHPPRGNAPPVPRNGSVARDGARGHRRPELSALINVLINSTALSSQRAPLSVLPIAGYKGRCAGPIPPLCRRKERRDLRSSRQDLEWKQPAPKPSDVWVEACPCFQLALCQVEAVRLRPCRRVERATSHRLRYAEKCELVAD